MFHNYEISTIIKLKEKSSQDVMTYANNTDATHLKKLLDYINNHYTPKEQKTFAKLRKEFSDYIDLKDPHNAEIYLLAIAKDKHLGCLTHRINPNTATQKEKDLLWADKAAAERNKFVSFAEKYEWGLINFNKINNLTKYIEPIYLAKLADSPKKRFCCF